MLNLAKLTFEVLRSSWDYSWTQTMIWTCCDDIYRLLTTVSWQLVLVRRWQFYGRNSLFDDGLPSLACIAKAIFSPHRITESDGIMSSSALRGPHRVHRSSLTDRVASLVLLMFCYIADISMSGSVFTALLARDGVCLRCTNSHCNDTWFWTRSHHNRTIPAQK